MATKKRKGMDLASIKNAISEINKEYGEDTVILAKNLPPVEFMSTGIPDLDKILGGGMPIGKVTMIYGPEGAGKTSFAFHMLSQYLKQNPLAVYVNAERALTEDRAKQFGIDSSKLIVVNPETGEQALSAAMKFAKEGVPFIVVDSVAALVPKKEFELESNTEKTAGISMTAGLLSRKIFGLNNLCDDYGSTVLFINQERDNMNAMAFGPQTHTPGGRALRHACHVILSVKRKEAIRVAGQQVGMIVRFNTGIKNRSASPYQEAEAPFIFDEGKFVSHENMTAEAKAARKRYIEANKNNLKQIAGYSEGEEE
ncbi:MAG TPA: ATPase domain-containing protein [Cyclobacteriaceae bacterium]|jgi:recombination protein RecA|nr:ATPase domain-containing protein [Cyclobacteriaceae bacterium]